MSKNITLPEFVATYEYQDKLEAGVGAVKEGLGFYKALTAMLQGDMRWDENDESFKGGPNGSIAKLCKAHGWNQSNVSKAGTVIRHMVPQFEELSAAELREQVIALVAQYGSVYSAYITIVPPTEPQGAGRITTPKTAREVLEQAWRKAQNEDLDQDAFLALAREVSTKVAEPAAA
jgi:hypothetical protein